MEILKINNFLSIEYAEIEIKRLNIFIGPQAQGKSVIAKLIYFFKEYPRTIVESVYRGMTTKDGCDKLVLANFEKIFPRYTWENDEFSIHYSNKYYHVSISNKAINNEKGKYQLELDSSFKVREVFVTLREKKPHDPSINDFNIDKPLDNPRFYYSNTKGRSIHSLVSKNFSFLDGALIDDLFKDNMKPYLEKNFYIPAGRSFFANLDKNIFSFISSEIKIEYFITLFGKNYEKIRAEAKEKNSLIWCNGTKKDRVNELIKYLVDGEISFEGGQDWITNKKRKISISDASSGQQEVFPMAVMLSTQPYVGNSYISHHFVIEEPETHIFPIAQSKIVSLIVNVYNSHSEYENAIDFINGLDSITITTHSPYILTAFNNLIQAGNVAASKNHQELDDLYKVVSKHEIVDFNDVAAYLVNEGKVKSILNHEFKIIDANIIDEVSNHFADTFEKLISMEEVDD